MAQAPGYELLERHMDYHARMMRLWKMADEELKRLAADLEREAKAAQRYAQKGQEAAVEGDFKGR